MTAWVEGAPCVFVRDIPGVSRGQEAVFIRAGARGGMVYVALSSPGSNKIKRVWCTATDVAPA